jgi:uncharacterized membrane protein YdjX (TVP38/TMEM64 family)
LNKKNFSFITLLISLIMVILLYPKLQHPAELQAFVAQWGLLSISICFAIVILLALFPVVPFVLMAGVNTLLYRWFGGYLISLSRSLLGATLGFWLARSLDKRGRSQR